MSEKKESFIKLDHCVLRYKYTNSKLMFVDGLPEKVEVTLLDKVIFVYMKNRYDYFTNSKGGKYYESYQQIAEPLGIDKKSVSRFVQKWKTHGYIDYFNGAGNRVNYTKMDCMFLGAYDKNIDNGVVDRPEIPDYLLSVPDDNSGYVPEFNEFDYNFEMRVGVM